MKASSEDAKWATLDWIARLPLLGAYELAMLLGVGERDAASLLSELGHNGWLESLYLDSPELEPGRVYALSRHGVSGLGAALGLVPRDLEAVLPVGAAELAQRRGRIQITVGVNRFAAELVAALRNAQGIELEDLRAVPWRRRSSIWRPAYVEAYGCLSAESAFAPFFIAWDRRGAPIFHRRRRVSAWYAFRDGEQPWGRNNLPSILILCPGEAEASAWEQAVLAAADRRMSSALPVLLAEIDAVFSADPLEALWRRAGGATELPLPERLNWRWTLPVEAASPRFQQTLPPILGDLVTGGSPACAGAPKLTQRRRVLLPRRRASNGRDREPGRPDAMLWLAGVWGGSALDSIWWLFVPLVTVSGSLRRAGSSICP